jgi:predicted transcriptional regulator
MSATVEINSEAVAKRLGREIEAWLRDSTVEQRYSAERAAELLEVSVRTVWNYVDEYEASAGRAGLGPVEKLSHKVVRIPASALNRFLASKRISAVARATMEVGT